MKIINNILPLDRWGNRAYKLGNLGIYIYLYYIYLKRLERTIIFNNNNY